jgi:phosphoribosylanthranilate isomerase
VPYTAFSINASLTLEAALVLPVFLAALVAVVFFLQAIQVQSRLQQSLYNQVKKVSGYAYYMNIADMSEQVEQIMRLGFDYIQIHGTLSDEVHDVLRIPVIRAVNVAGETAEDKESIRRQLESVLADEKTAGILFDGSSPGAGKTFDWSLLKNIQKTDKLLFLAGGLTPENAAQAVKTVAPDVVDVSSGVEKDVSPCAAFAGKDAEKITKFVENVRL